jgi:hypothetical protein
LTKQGADSDKSIGPERVRFRRHCRGRSAATRPACPDKSVCP